MTDAAARFVYPILDAGLAVRDHLAAGRPVAFEREHARLKELLLAASESAAVGPRPADRPPAGGFLGGRFALACWLDELFTTGRSPWRDVWNERKLEVELYGSNDRAWKFWEQARLAEQQPADDALEAYFLCVQLGFRGVLLEDPAKLKEWAGAARQRLWELPPAETPYDLEPDPPFAAPPRDAARRFDRMLGAAAAVALVLIPAAAFVAVSGLAGR